MTSSTSRSATRRPSPRRRVNTSLRLRATTLHELKLIAAHKGFSIQAMLERLVERYVEKKRVKILGKAALAEPAAPLRKPRGRAAAAKRSPQARKARGGA